MENTIYYIVAIAGTIIVVLVILKLIFTKSK